jgi:hypothetical protein
MSFNNLHLVENINNARSALKGKSGVYAIVYSVTGAIYILQLLKQRVLFAEINRFIDLHFTDTLKTARATRDVWCILLL